MDLVPKICIAVLITLLLMFLLSVWVVGVFAGEVITASWYSVESCKREGTSGIWTASGERFTNEGLTCAMRSRDFGAYYKITNLDNGKSVVVRHNDFGPNKKLWNKVRRVDLSRGAFSKIAPLSKGVIPISIERIK